MSSLLSGAWKPDLLPVLLTAVLVLQHKDRIDTNLIKPAVDWRKAGSRNAMMSAAIAR